jgi:cell division protein FtsX
VKKNWRIVFRFVGLGCVVGFLASVLPLFFVRYSTERVFLFVLHLSPSVWLLRSHNIDPFFDMTTIGILFGIVGAFVVLFRRNQWY